MSRQHLRCLTADRQSHDGPVDGSTPEVAYLCTGGTDNTLRRTGIIYPSSRQLGYEPSDRIGSEIASPVSGLPEGLKMQ